MIMFCFSKVSLKSLLFFTTVLLIVGDSKGVQTKYDIIEYAMNNVPQKIEIFNQQCLFAIFNYVDIELKVANEVNLRDLREYVFSILRVIDDSTEAMYRIFQTEHRQYVNKLIPLFYMRTPRFWTTRKENEIYMEYIPKKKVNSPRMNTFLEQLNSTKQVKNVEEGESSESMTNAAYTFCKETFSALSRQSVAFLNAFNYVTNNYHVQCPDELHELIRFGYLVYLMTDDEIVHLHNLAIEARRRETEDVDDLTIDTSSYRYLICIMRDALFDVHRGVIHLLSDIDNLMKDADVENIYVQILKMLRLMYYSIIDVAEKIFTISNVIGIKNQGKKSVYPGKLYNYDKFNKKFQDKWSKLVRQIKKSKSKISKSAKGKEKVGESEKGKEKIGESEKGKEKKDIVPSVRKTADERIKNIENGRLIKNNYVTPSLSRHFSVYNKSWKDVEILDQSNTDYKILLALDLNAWMSLIHNYCYKMMCSLRITQNRKKCEEEYNIGNEETLTMLASNVLEYQIQNRKFDKDKEFMNSFNDLFS